MLKWLSLPLKSVSFTCDFLFEGVGGFECRDIMLRDYEGRVLTDVAGGLLCTGLDDERAEATEIYVFAVCKAVLDNGHKLFDYGNNGRFVDACCLCDFIRYFCFSHFPVLLWI